MKFFPKANLFESHIVPSQPIDEIASIYEASLKSMENELKIPKDVLDSFKLKDTLNPDFWTNDKLNPEIRKKLIEIANNFVAELELPEIKLKDILFVGSLANYNWSEYSDIDLHLVVDFSEFKENPDFIKSFFDAQKNLFNLKHDIQIADHPVETYFQDTKEKLAASAIYSIKYNKWILKPEKTSFKLDKLVVKRKVNKFFDKLKEIKSDYTNGLYQKCVEETDKLKNSLKTMRKSGLEKGGEFSTENIVFKILRRTDAIELLDSIKVKAYDQLMTITENIDEADKIIPYDENPELRAAAKNGVSNKEVISDEKLYNVMAQLSMAKEAVLAFKKAFENNEPNFTVNWMGKPLNGRIIPEMLSNKDNLHYFDVPEMGDGGFQYKLYRNGNLVGANVQSRPDMIHNPNMTSATDAGYNKTFDDRIKYFKVKAGLNGKYQESIYSVFATPAIDGAIKVRVINHTEILDFLTKDKGTHQYTSDEKGAGISNQMDFKKKIEKIRKDAEQIIGKPISGNQQWLTWREELLKRLNTPEKQAASDITQDTKDFVEYYKSHNLDKNIGKPEISMSPEEKADFEARQEKYRQKLKALRLRRGN